MFAQYGNGLAVTARARNELHAMQLASQWLADKRVVSVTISRRDPPASVAAEQAAARLGGK